MRRQPKLISPFVLWALTFAAAFALTSFLGFNGVLDAAQTSTVEPEQQTAGSNTPDVNITVGFEGVVRLGHWVPVTFAAESPIDAVSFRVTSLDGDDTPATVSGRLSATRSNSSKNSTGQPNRFMGMMQFGRTYGIAKFELLDANENVVFSKTGNVDIKKNELAELVPSTTGLVLLLEPEHDTPSGSESKTIRSLEASVASAFPTGDAANATRVVAIHDLGQIPIHSIALSSCDSIVLSAAGNSLLDSASPAVWDSIEHWVRNGGQLVVAASPADASVFQANGVLQRFSPGEINGSVTLDSSRRIEEFSSSKDQLLRRGETIEILSVENVDGRVLLQQGDLPLVIRKPVGLGEVMLVTLDLTSEKFSAWSGSDRFIKNLLNSRYGTDEMTKSRNVIKSSTAVRHSGYQDIIGQLKVPLERFSSLKFIPFALVATLIALYILCIGVGDWFLVSRVFRRHEFTWLTFPLLAILFCGIAWWLADFSRPATMKLNQVEIVDVDSISGHVRSTAWSNLYSPRGGVASIDVAVTAGSDFKLTSSSVSWQGLPGDGLSGMLNRANPGLYRAGYQQRVTPSLQSTAVNVSLEDVELQVSSTRPLYVQWQGEFKGDAASGLVFEDRLEGFFTNPLNVRLKNCKLFFEDLVYIVKDRGEMDAGENMDLFSETNEKSIRSFMTRRFRLEDEKNKSQSVAWDPRDRDLSRIASMLMFYRSAGGQDYVGLTHAYHDFIEMTPNLSMDRAILVGELDDRVSQLQIEGQPADEIYDSSLTMVRIVLPVRRLKK